MKSLKNKKLKKMEFGFECVQKAKKDNLGSNFRIHIKNIPMYINVNGLVPTIAFIMSKANKKNKESESYNYIAEVIVKYLNKFKLISDKPIKIFKNNKIEGLEELIEELFSKSMTEYRRCTLEVLSMLEWMVKFSEGMIEKEEKKDTGDNNDE